MKSLLVFLSIVLFYGNVIAGTFPGQTTGAELDYVHGVTSPIQTQLDNKQPLDSDLTAIAAVVTVSWGRDLLTLASASAARTYLDVYSTSEINAYLGTKAASGANADIDSLKDGVTTTTQAPSDQTTKLATMEAIHAIASSRGYNMAPDPYFYHAANGIETWSTITNSDFGPGEFGAYGEQSGTTGVRFTHDGKIYDYIYCPIKIPLHYGDSIYISLHGELTADYADASNHGLQAYVQAYDKDGVAGSSYGFQTGVGTLASWFDYYSVNTITDTDAVYGIIVIYIGDSGASGTGSAYVDRITVELVNSIYSRSFDITPGVEGWQGPSAADAIAGEALSVGDIVYRKNVSGATHYFKYSANSTFTDNATYRPCGIATTAAAGAASTFTLGFGHGVFRMDSYSFVDADRGKTVYASETAGSITITAPSDVDDLVYPLGSIISPDVVEFDFNAGNGSLVRVKA